MTDAQTMQTSIVHFDVQLPERLVVALKKDKTELPSYFRTQTALNEYQRGVLSFGQAAELAGMAKVDFLQLLSEHKLSLFRYSPDALKDEISSV